MGSMDQASEERTLPVAVERDTIIEFIHELRFKPARTGVGDLLPGILSQRLAEDFPHYERLPGADLPSVIRQHDPAMEFAGLHRLVGQGQSLTLGERVVTLSILRPYPGWPEVLRRTGRLINALRETKLILDVERVSVRYSNLIPPGDEVADLQMLKVRLELDGFELSIPGVHIRAEIPDGKCQSIVQILQHAIAEIPSRGEKLEGLLLDVDTLLPGPFSDFWGEYPELLEKVHLAEKRVFFGLLSEDTLERLGPKWG